MLVEDEGAWSPGAAPLSLMDPEEDNIATAMEEPEPMTQPELGSGSEMSADEVRLVTGPSRGKQVEFFHEAPEDLKDKRLIAFPVFAEDGNKGPAHWTLGILYNALWKENLSNHLSKQTDYEWMLFHFDSARCNKQSKINAISLAQFLTKTDFKKDIKFIEVLVPLQGSFSNDCGLYPAHYLKLFCLDVEDSIAYCTSVSVLKHVLTRPSIFLLSTQDFGKLNAKSPEVVERWEGGPEINLCKKALDAFRFYQDIHRLSVQRKERAMAL
jgi:hypothetical protein